MEAFNTGNHRHQNKHPNSEISTTFEALVEKPPASFQYRATPVLQRIDDARLKITFSNTEHALQNISNMGHQSLHQNCNACCFYRFEFLRFKNYTTTLKKRKSVQRQSGDSETKHEKTLNVVGPLSKRKQRKQKEEKRKKKERRKKEE